MNIPPDALEKCFPKRARAMFGVFKRPRGPQTIIVMRRSFAFSSVYLFILLLFCFWMTKQRTGVMKSPEPNASSPALLSAT